jgi:hypothetical protein
VNDGIEICVVANFSALEAALEHGAQHLEPALEDSIAEQTDELGSLLLLREQRAEKVHAVAPEETRRDVAHQKHERFERRRRRHRAFLDVDAM